MILGIIPARYASTRFPGKPLIDIQGKSMIQRVVEAAQQAKKLDRVVVATDDTRIADHVSNFGGEAMMTREDHASGTDRCWEVVSRQSSGDSQKHATPTIDYRLSTIDYVLNIQGDEPFLDPAQIDELAGILDGKVELATQMIRVDSAEVLHDPGEAKILLNDRREAIYFSRQAVPFLKGIDPAEWHEHFSYYRHVGMYAYRVDVLEKLTRLPPSPLEKAESLEQLRWLQAGYRIRLVETKHDSHCIDTPDDVVKVLRRLGR
ncbi:MAG: 3-deoxy-manno-octulosonate cytidylyltransferase [Sphingobacteriaceae bacterium]|nr:3-deoxy-manno-octulosonate cytidylyltransferase [Cytophagaceae bacterium]